MRFAKLFLCLFLAVLSARPESSMAASIRVPRITVQTADGRKSELSTQTLIASITYHMGLPPFGQKITELSHPIVALYEDGTLIWSDNHMEGGAPYHRTVVPAAVVKKVKARIASQEYFRKTDARTQYLIPDSTSVEICIRGQNAYFVMESYHDLFEQSPNLVATGTGVRSLESGESRAQVLAKEPKEYQEFRAAWSWTKRMLLDTIPLDAPADPTTLTLHTSFSFVEAQPKPKSK